jgi:hypothetical protein
LQSKHIDYAINRFRHDSGFFKITVHALYKTYAIFATAASASYIILFLFAGLIFALLILAITRLLFPHCRLSLFFHSVDFATFIKATCKLFALFVCFSLPIFIQQGDIDSSANSNFSQGADAGCVYFHTIFIRNASTATANHANLIEQRSDLYCDSTFWTHHLAAYFTGTYPSVFYQCPMRMSFATLYARAASLSSAAQQLSHPAGGACLCLPCLS